MCTMRNVYFCIVSELTALFSLLWKKVFYTTVSLEILSNTKEEHRSYTERRKRQNTALFRYKWV